VDSVFHQAVPADPGVQAVPVFQVVADHQEVGALPEAGRGEIIEWSSHSFELTEQMQVIFDQFIVIHENTYGVSFVVTVGNERIYLGTFRRVYSSVAPPPCAVIYLIVPFPHAIHLAEGAIDKRYDCRIYNCLKNSGVLVE
jgi:hypothetical protein